MQCVIAGAGLIGPGLVDWPTAQPVLTGARALVEPAQWGEHLPPLTASMLPPTERRRAGQAVRLAVMVAEQTLHGLPIDPVTLALVFASSTGDTQVLTEICASLATEERAISPMRFHNSVHNAPSGYWTIHTGGRMPATAVALYHDTVAAGLREAMTQVVAEQLPVLLVVHDVPFPPPLAAVEPVCAPFGFGLLLLPTGASPALARLTLRRLPAGEATGMVDPSLEHLRLGVPAARGLPLLAALARLKQTGVGDTVQLADGTGMLALTVESEAKA
ncbi:beta-ketoacyl synthase chain length factor [Halothiobacillus sp. DCM-1]|uniref:beta-ketoacyl synthase chain length factor n=1 Tax=Halothiobacillus sp. DCM-1 TaxID=3112558 RepID=UPI003245AAAE